MLPNGINRYGGIVMIKKQRINYCVKLAVMKSPEYRKETTRNRASMIKSLMDKVSYKRITSRKWKTNRSTSRTVRLEKRICVGFYSNSTTGTPFDEPCCACCGETSIELLSIDHIDGKVREGAKKMSGLKLYLFLMQHGFPLGYRVLCYNCNAGEGWFGKCPHRKTGM